jgi:hypothetical protein
MKVVEELLEKCSTTKVCGNCKKSLPLFDFTVNKAAKDGLQYKCRSCDNLYQIKRRSKNREAMVEYHKNYRARNKDNLSFRLQALLNASRQRAVLKGREHSITIEDLKELYPKDGKCPVFGFDLEFGNAGFRETSPSVDRIDSTKGYTRDNIQIISWKANRLKAYATVEDLEILVAFLKQGE